ncbi:MAG: hypothetical protein HKP48_09295 [Winogradskyella sp.]|uniref:hypothetical protein n=1 Tax=Winogradskyella sp. TaxID=1883156 RepID=UPI0017DC9181|nr:hypothetical protein [Winogradskyella sp.]MBT8244244.1 hypothetical protein [Winogradskyella sp.]NNK23465.1 hypothetical protein [Winogradskyella sp.]
MAPIKFEEQIMEKLEQRTVNPSADAWSKLSERLDADDKRSKKPSFWWFGIAASIAALVFVSIAYFDQEDEETSIDTIIVQDEIKDVISQNPEDEAINANDALEKEEKLASKKEETFKGFETQTEASKTLIKQKANQFKKDENVSSKPITNDVASSEQPKLPKTNKIELEKTLQDLVTPKLEEEFNSVATVIENAKTKRKNTVTDQQIDSLLKIANRELLLDKTLKKSTYVVDADALLQDVEEDIGQSFKTRIYKVLKDNYNKVKTAVAQRNN